MKNLVLLVHEDAGQAARLEAALDLTRALEAHLRCVDVTPVPVFPGDFDGAAAGLVLEAGRKAEARNRPVVEGRLGREGVSWDWVENIGDMSVCLLGQSRLADAIIVNCKRDEWFDFDQGLVADLVVRAGCPIVATPETDRGLAVSGPVMVAWDGSAAAAAALRAGVPLLKLAEVVHIVTVGEIAEGPGPEEAAVYLSRHGVSAEVHTIETDEPPAPHLLRFAAHTGVGYCLMGAYGHGRLTETLFGGVTRAMVERALIPLVLAR